MSLTLAYPMQEEREAHALLEHGISFTGKCGLYSEVALDSVKEWLSRELESRLPEDTDYKATQLLIQIIDLYSKENSDG